MLFKNCGYRTGVLTGNRQAEFCLIISKTSIFYSFEQTNNNYYMNQRKEMNDEIFL